MARQHSLVAEMPPVSMLVSAADAAGRVSPYRSLQYAHKAWIVASVDQGDASTVDFTVLQAQDASGTGSKPMTARVWSNLDTVASPNFVSQTNGSSYTTDAGLKNKLVVFEVDPSELDVNGGFSYIALSTGASNAANVTGAIMLALSRYQQAVQPSDYS